MRAVVQRVEKASVHIGGREHAHINAGLLVLIAIEIGDTDADLEWLCGKITRMRIFNDAEGVMNLDITRVHGELMLVSQFTLHASTAKGNRPSYIRAARPDGAPIYVILDNLSAHKGTVIRQWAARNKVELCFTPTYASWANPIEAHFGPLRTFVIAGSDHPNHVTLGRHLHRYLRWRNVNARHPDVLAAQRRERAKVRSERHRTWGHTKTRAA